MEERKIIGYNLTETQYKDTVLKLLVEGKQLGRELGFGVDVQKQENIDKFNELGLLDKWFEPVYEKNKIMSMLTEDYVNVFVGDKIFWTRPDGDKYRIVESVVDEQLCFLGGSFIKYFSNKEALDVYIMKDKCFKKLNYFNKGDVLFNIKTKNTFTFFSFTFINNISIVYEDGVIVYDMEEFLENIFKIETPKPNEKLIKLSELKSGDVFKFISEETTNTFVNETLEGFFYYWVFNEDLYNLCLITDNNFVLKITEKEEVEFLKAGDWIYNKNTGNIYRKSLTPSKILNPNDDLRKATIDEVIDHLGKYFSKLYDGEIKVTFNDEYFTVSDEKGEIIYRTF